MRGASCTYLHKIESDRVCILIVPVHCYNCKIATMVFLGGTENFYVFTSAALDADCLLA